MIENIHWLGHASFKIKDDEIIYIDPYQIKDKDKADIILATHDHFDHCSVEDIEKISKSDTIIVGPRKIAKILKGQIKTISPGEKINIKDIEIEGIPSYNLNKSFHQKKEENLGFIIKIKDTKIYHTGDTDFIPEMENIKCDICLLPVGGTYTMDAKEAAKAADVIKPKIAIPMHWGSIVGSKEDAEEFERLCKCEVRILEKEG